MVDGNDKPKAVVLTKPLFVYLRGTNKGLPLKELREAGYVPVPVDDLDSYQIVDPVFTADTDLLKQAAYDTLMNESYPSKEKFAQRVLKKLTEQGAV